MWSKTIQVEYWMESKENSGLITSFYQAQHAKIPSLLKIGDWFWIAHTLKVTETASTYVALRV